MVSLFQHFVKKKKKSLFLNIFSILIHYIIYLAFITYIFHQVIF